MIVAIDGPAGAGKSTVARRVARRLGAAYLDTGAMYRAIAWLAGELGVEPSDGEGLTALARAHPVLIVPTDDGDRVSIAGRDVTRLIRDPAVSARVSEVSAHPGVRAEVVAAQRALMESGEWVSDGRDVGSTVCPTAEVKVFLTASLEERARRRRDELAARGLQLTLERVLDDVRKRDHIDSHREASPMRVAEGAVVIDSSELEIDEVVERVLELAAQARERGGSE